MRRKFVFLIVAFCICVNLSALSVSAGAPSPRLDMSVTDMASYGLDVYTIDIDVVNCPEYFVVAVASYDDDGNMLQMKILEADDYKTSLEKNKVKKIQSFLWDGFEKLKPLTGSTIYIKNGGGGGGSSSGGSQVKPTPVEIKRIDVENNVIWWSSVSSVSQYYIKISRLTDGVHPQTIDVVVPNSYTMYCFSSEIEQLVLEDKQSVEHFLIEVTAVTNFGYVTKCSVPIHKEYY